MDIVDQDGHCGARWTLWTKMDIVGQEEATWTRTTKERESWRALAEDYFLQWKNTA